MQNRSTGPAKSRTSKLTWSLATLLLLAVLVGGQGSGKPLLEMIIQLAALIVVYFTLGSTRPDSPGPARAANWVVGAMLLLVIVHLIPLPYGIWSSLTPSSTAQDVLTGYRLDSGWRPFTMVPHEGMANLLLLVPPLAAYYATAALDDDQRFRLVLLVITLSAASVILGMLQFASRSAAYYLYDQVSRGYAIGFFSNRNHQADLAIIGWLLFTGVIDSEKAIFRQMGSIQKNLLVAAGSAFFIFGVLATGSRGGLMLAGFAGVVILATRFKQVKAGLLGGFAALCAAAATLFAIATFSGNRLVGATISRFEADDEMRLQIWPEVVRMIGDTMPLGSGIGSFVTYYRHDEPLAKVGARYVNSAHNEYLEIALEAGLPGLAVVIAGLAILVWAGWVLVHSRDRARETIAAVRLMAMIAVIVVLAHSTFDYPLRTTSLAVVFALLCSLILNARGDSPRRISKVSKR